MGKKKRGENVNCCPTCAQWTYCPKLGLGFHATRPWLEKKKLPMNKVRTPNSRARFRGTAIKASRTRAVVRASGHQPTAPSFQHEVHDTDEVKSTVAATSQGSAPPVARCSPHAALGRGVPAAVCKSRSGSGFSFSRATSWPAAKPTSRARAETGRGPATPPRFLGL